MVQRKMSKNGSKKVSSNITKGVDVGPEEAVQSSKAVVPSGLTKPCPYINVHDAAQILSRHLGQGFDHWHEFLIEDIGICASYQGHEDDDGLNYEFVWQYIGGIQYCLINELYHYIAKRNPTGLGIVDCSWPDERPPFFQGHVVSVDVDHERGGRLLIWMRAETEFPEHAHPNRALTANEAKALADQLLEAVRFCESHQYNHVKREVEKKGITSSARVMRVVRGYRDPEVDALLKDLEGAAPIRSKVNGKRANAR